MNKKFPYKRLKRGYKIELTKIVNGVLLPEQICHANTNKEGRTILFKKIKCEDWELAWTLEDITYLNIPVVRETSHDIYDFEGKEKTHHQIEDILFERKRLNDLIELSKLDVKYFYIRKDGLYYRPNSAGYTDKQFQAGIYEKEDAIDSAKHCRNLTLIPIDIKKHNKLIQEEITKLKTLLINE